MQVPAAYAALSMDTRVYKTRNLTFFVRTVYKDGVCFLWHVLLGVAWQSLMWYGLPCAKDRATFMVGCEG